ncbi:MAG: 1-acyl-sn-glycerol-3-phosphate acyltransferase, partial [Algoriella sp.]
RIKKRGINATLTFKEPLEIDYENDSSDAIMQKIMNAIEQAPEFNKVRPINEILEENREKSLDDYLNEDDDEEFDDFDEMGYDEENKKD